MLLYAAFTVSKTLN